MQTTKYKQNNTSTTTITTFLKLPSYLSCNAISTTLADKSTARKQEAHRY